MNSNNIPLINNKNYKDNSIFTPENLIREAKRQKEIKKVNLPEICILDPDGDLTDYLLQNNLATINKSWCCYHTDLYNFKYNNIDFGIIPFVVGASFAVLVAEELFVLGCNLLFLLTSSGKLTEIQNSRKFVVIEKSIRDEGVSYHYLPPDVYSSINSKILQTIKNIDTPNPEIYFSTSWTTDAPFRETQESIDNAIKLGADLVEMESAGLYAFSQAKNKPVICIAHITNEMGQNEGDFEKGHNNGSNEALDVISEISKIFENIKKDLEN